MEQTSVQVGGRLDQFEKPHEIVTVQRCESLNGELDLSGVPNSGMELLHLPVR